MDTKLTLTIIGSVLSLIGVIFIAIPKVVNEKTMSNLPSEAVGISALFRAANGGLGLALGLVQFIVETYRQNMQKLSFYH